MTPEQRKLIREALDEMDSPPKIPTIKYCIGIVEEKEFGGIIPLPIKLHCDEFEKPEVKAIQI